MSINSNHEKALHQAQAMYLSGHDNTYITLQLAEQGIDDPTIDAVINEIGRCAKRKKEKQV